MYCISSDKNLTIASQEQFKILGMGITGPEGHPLSRPEEVRPAHHNTKLVHNLAGIKINCIKATGH